MAIKFSKVIPGMELLDIHSEPMGNTTMRRLGLWKVKIISVDQGQGTATVSWNTNPPQKWDRRRVERLYTKPTKAYLAQQERRRNGGIL